MIRVVEANCRLSSRSGATLAEVWTAYRRSSTVDPATLRSYESLYTRHVDPHLGNRQVRDITAEDVTVVLGRARSAGLSETTVRHCWVVVSLLCRRAAAAGLVERAVTEQVPMPKASPVVVRVMTPEEFLRIQEKLPTPGAQLLAELLVRSGLRLGEAFALAPGDVEAGALQVARCLSEPGRRYSADGSRFVIRPSTKTGAARRVQVGEHVAERLRAWAAVHSLAEGDFLFPARLVLPSSPSRAFPAKIYTEPLSAERLAALGTFVGPNGRTYQHGSVNGYTTGRCRESCCRQAVSEYSAMRRRARNAAAGAARRPPAVPPGAAGEGRSDATTGAVEPQVWARVWSTAVREAGLDFSPHARHTRHAHASWLNSGGTGSRTIADRLGHRDDRSTLGYVLPVGPEPDVVTVLDALLVPTTPPAARTRTDDL